MSSSIVHFGKGNYGAIPEGKGGYIDPTVAKPRATIPAIRLQALRRLRPVFAVRPAPIERGPIQYKPGSILAMRDGQCRFPIDDKRFCGARSVKSKSWCPYHDDIVYGRQKLEAAE